MLWVNGDRLVRDGDEEGHVGAAELYLQDLNAGDFWGYLSRAWVGSEMGEYPQAFAATLGGWWWLMDGGDPSRAQVRMISLLLLGLSAFVTGQIARRLVRPEKAQTADTVAMITVLVLPLCNGLSRHFMPENMLVLATGLAILAALHLAEHPSRERALLAGTAIGLGLLTKQTFALVAAAPLVFLLWRPILRRPRLLGFLSIGVALTIGPWLSQHMGGQVAYLGDSAVGKGDAAWWQHLGYYPWSVAWLGLGPVLTALSVVAAATLWRHKDRRALMLGTAWLVGGVIVLTVLPKKYPRLMAPLLPGVAIWIGVAVCRLRHPLRWTVVAGGLAAAWLIIASFFPLPLQLSPPGVDPGCPQAWLRPPIDDDLGLGAVATTAKTMNARTIAVVDAPAIPCDVQTTHDWITHLGPYLRRAGHEAQISTSSPERADLVVDWTQGPGEEVAVPALGQRFWLKKRATVTP